MQRGEGQSQGESDGCPLQLKRGVGQWARVVLTLAAFNLRPASPSEKNIPPTLVGLYVCTLDAEFQSLC